MEDDAEALRWTRHQVVDGVRNTEDEVGREDSHHAAGGVVDDPGVAGLHLGHPPLVATHLQEEAGGCRGNVSHEEYG